jgi:signal transduction histidine kinase
MLVPLMMQGKLKNLHFLVKTIGSIPIWMHFDQRVYEFIMYHIVCNSIKFSSNEGPINITIQYVSMDTKDIKTKTFEDYFNNIQNNE